MADDMRRDLVFFIVGIVAGYALSLILAAPY